MPDILFIKTSSLGDVIHHMPALTDARRQLPQARLSWVVEEAYAPLVRLHPAIDEVIAVASRRWRGEPFKPSAWRSAARFVRALRARDYDEIVDAQGLVRSALIAKLARGRRHGYDQASVRERFASKFYDVRHAVARTEHAIARNRLLTGLALGYAPQGAPDFGLDRARLVEGVPPPYAIFLHASARREKEWPEANWRSLLQALDRRGVQLLLTAGSEAEQARSARIAADIRHARVPMRRPLDAMARLIAGAAFVVGVDTGLLHVAAALSVPLVAIFIASEPALTGPVGSGPIAVLGGDGRVPAVEEVAAAVEKIAPA